VITLISGIMRLCPAQPGALVFGLRTEIHKLRERRNALWYTELDAVPPQRLPYRKLSPRNLLMTAQSNTRQRILIGLVFPALLCLLAVAPSYAEDLSQTYTQAEPPSREALERLNLKLGWSLNLPLEGRRDGIYTVQPVDREVFVQTRSGLVVVVDANTGKIKWSARVGNAYRPSQPFGYNRMALFVVNGAVLYVLDRDDGKILWQIRLPGAISAPPVADETQLWLMLGGERLKIYQLPTRQELAEYAKADSAKPAEAPEPRSKDFPKSTYGVRGANISSLAPSSRLGSDAQTTGLQAKLLGEFFLGSSVVKAALLTAETTMLPGTRGVVTGITRNDPKQAYRLPLDGDIGLQPGQYAEVGFIAAQDYNLYAVSIDSGRVLWRFSDGTLFSQPPAVNEQGVFAATERRGMYCIDRETGDLKWRNADAGRFLASNPKFVYAMDRSNRFLVLDRERGTKLSSYDLRDFVHPITNDRTDRIYLAAHNGLLISLHDRDYDKPLVLKKDAKAAAPAAGVGKPGERPPPKETPKEGGDNDKPKEPVDKNPLKVPDDKPKDKND
jgi:outer membrane protein assembly factor BamB